VLSGAGDVSRKFCLPVEIRGLKQINAVEVRMNMSVPVWPTLKKGDPEFSSSHSPENPSTPILAYPTATDVVAIFP